MKYSKAKFIADGFIEKINPYCEKIEMAGSLRRKCKLVHDIDIVVIPKGEMELDLFGGASRFVSSLDPILNKMSFTGGERYKKLELEGITIDLWITNGSDWGRIFCIRTGDFEFVRTIIASRWVKLGWVGTRNGLRRKEECEKVGGQWKVIVDNPFEPPAFETEEAFIKWLRLEYVEPIYRTNFHKQKIFKS